MKILFILFWIVVGVFALSVILSWSRLSKLEAKIDEQTARIPVWPDRIDYEDCGLCKG